MLNTIKFKFLNYYSYELFLNSILLGKSILLFTLKLNDTAVDGLIFICEDSADQLYFQASWIVRCIHYSQRLKIVIKIQWSRWLQPVSQGSRCALHLSVWQSERVFLYSVLMIFHHSLTCQTLKTMPRVPVQN